MPGNQLSANLAELLTLNGWAIVGSLEIPGREKATVPISDLTLNPSTEKFLQGRFPEGVYAHQYQAVRVYQSGENVCLLSGTASGKSLVFYIAGVEELYRNPQSRLLAIYPLKALGAEQETRWGDALEAAGLDRRTVGRIDGNVPVTQRQGLLRTARVLIATPDVLHAWLLSSLSEPAVNAFLRNLRVIVTDEIHGYAGVFGSNSAYLFRRLRYVLGVLGRSPQFIAASATVASPESHLLRLFGVPFKLIPQEADTSPKYPATVMMAIPPRQSDLLSETAVVLEYLATATDSRFVAFVDSRKVAEHLATIASRLDIPPEDPEEGQRSSDDRPPRLFDHLERLRILPFRAGYEQRDRDRIQQRLTAGQLRGVVSTSALELGVDITHLDCGILLGVPRSATSLMQRIGRVGRRRPGAILVVNTGSLHDEAVFRRPLEVLNRPYAEAALYLENRRIQYIHTLCLARAGGEHDQVCATIGRPNQLDLLTHVEWPAGFIDLSRKERLGEIEPDLQSMKVEGGDSPNHAFPLRDVESQFQVELRSGPLVQTLGSLSFSQVMREAYPGAVYYYTTLPYRVGRVDIPGRMIQVFPERRYFTSPTKLPISVFPNLSHGNVFGALEFADGLRVIECNVQIREALSGYVERRGQTKTQYQYPISPIDSAKSGIVFRGERFSRNFFTTGVVLVHPQIAEPDAGVRAGELIYEAFLTLVPFERQDINFAAGRLGADRPPYGSEGNRFLAIYDQTYGSLRLTSRLLDPAVLREVLRAAAQVSVVPELEVDARVTAIIEALVAAAEATPQSLGIPGPAVSVADRYAKVVMPGSRGLVVTRANEEAEILRVFVHPTFGLCYKVEYDGMFPSSDLDVILPVANVSEVPGESKVGWYDYQTGELLTEPPEGA